MSRSATDLTLGVVFWMLGSSLFLTLAVFPNLLMTWFFTGPATHAIVVAILATILLLMMILPLVSEFIDDHME
jgi:hypothetical protein